MWWGCDCHLPFIPLTHIHIHVLKNKKHTTWNNINEHTCPDKETYPGEYYSKNVTDLRDLKQYPFTRNTIQILSGDVMTPSPKIVSRHDDRDVPKGGGWKHNMEHSGWYWLLHTTSQSGGPVLLTSLLSISQQGQSSTSPVTMLLYVVLEKLFFFYIMGESVLSRDQHSLHIEQNQSSSPHHIWIWRILLPGKCTLLITADENSFVNVID